MRSSYELLTCLTVKFDMCSCKDTLKSLESWCVCKIGFPPVDIVIWMETCRADNPALEHGHAPIDSTSFLPPVNVETCIPVMQNHIPSVTTLPSQYLWIQHIYKCWGGNAVTCQLAKKSRMVWSWGHDDLDKNLESKNTWWLTFLADMQYSWISQIFFSLWVDGWQVPLLSHVKHNVKVNVERHG